MWNVDNIDNGGLVLSFVDKDIGWGLFAGKKFEKGDYICRYGALATSSEKIVDRDYTMMSGVAGVAYDASKYRNLGGFINHDNNPNVTVYEYNCFS